MLTPPALRPMPAAFKWFALLWTLPLLAAFVPLLPPLANGFPWRGELFFSLILGAFLVASFRWSIAASIAQTEFFSLVLPCLLFIAWSAVSVLWAQNPRAVWHHTLVWACYLIFYCLMRRAVADKRLVRLSLVSLGTVIWLIAVPCIIEYFFGLSKEAATATLGFRYAKYGEAFNTFLPVLLALTLRLRGRAFWLSAITILLAWLFLQTTLSRSVLLLGIAGVGTTAAVCLLAGATRRTKRRLAFLIPALMAILLFAQFSGQVTTAGRFAADETKTSTAVRPLFGAVAVEMLKANLLAGIGAGNYGVQFDEYRAVYAAANPSDTNLNVLEGELAERAHNEYLQVFAELGIIGGAFFAWFLSGIGLSAWQAVKHGKRISPANAAAFIGLLMFLANSLVSSYSFRLLPNALVFFFVLALATKKYGADKIQQRREIRPPQMLFSRAAVAASLLACLSLALLSGLRGASAFYLSAADSAAQIEDAAPLYEAAANLDAENSAAYYSYGVRLFLGERPREAVPILEKAIENGMTATVCYSYLASAQLLSNDATAAERTFERSVKIYPRSIFARTRYTLLLEQNSKLASANEQREIALRLDVKQAKGWRQLITKGAASAMNQSLNDKDSAAPMDLIPQNALYAVLDERVQTNPGERASANR